MNINNLMKSTPRQLYSFHGNERDIAVYLARAVTIDFGKIRTKTQRWLSSAKENMSTAAQCVSGFGQGTDTSTVLTNRSKHITIIADEPYFSRHSRTFPPARHKKGTRPVHRTTLTYEVKPVQTTYVSCMKAVGKHFFSWTVWGNRCELFKFSPRRVKREDKQQKCLQ